MRSVIPDSSVQYRAETCRDYKLYFSSIGGQMVTHNIVLVPTYGGFIAKVSRREVL